MYTSWSRPIGTAALTGVKLALAAAVLAGVLTGPSGAAAIGFAGGKLPLDAGAWLRVPVHGSHEDEIDRDGAIDEAKHVVDELSAEKKIDDGWKAASVAGAETRTMRVFKMWVVHFHSAADIGGHGTDLFVFMSLKGDLLKYNYSGR